LIENNFMRDVQLGFVSIIRTTFDVELAQAMTERVRTALVEAQFSLINPSHPVTTLDEAQIAAQELAQHPLDLLLILQATFADSTMVMALAQSSTAPLVLWAVPEEHTGGRLRLNSLCGINLAGHTLTRAGHHYHHLYAAPDDEKALETVRILARAGSVRRRLQHTRIGRVGEPPTGFDTCRVDNTALRERFGIEIVQLDLQNTIFAGVRTAETGDVNTVAKHLNSRVANLNTVDAAATQGTLSAYIAMREIAERQRLDGFAVRCWPEFFTELGCAACGAMSLLSDEMKPCSCEADVNGTITQLILQWLSDEPAFGSDIVSVDEDNDALVLWHCGLAPLSMADPQTMPSVTIHSNRKLPLLMDFSLKPGPVTVARLSEATGQYRLVVGNGEIVSGKKCFSGTTGLLHFARPAYDVLTTILDEGLEHHISITYGDHVPELLALARMLNLPVLHLQEV
jgi:L-fucose isomerase-like protein